jgi:hypothetical protein
MSATLAEITVAIIAAVLFFKFGVELAPYIIRWWKGLQNTPDDDERNDHEQKQ